MKIISRNLSPLQICTFAHLILDLLALVFGLQILFFSKKIPEDAVTAKRSYKNKINCYFHYNLSHQKSALKAVPIQIFC